MQLPPRFHLVIDGTLHKVNRRANIATGGLAHLIAHLLTGGEVPDSAWALFGLRVVAEVDTDQGDYEPTAEDYDGRVRRQLPEPPRLG